MTIVVRLSDDRCKILAYSILASMSSGMDLSDLNAPITITNDDHIAIITAVIEHSGRNDLNDSTVEIWNDRLK